MTNKITCREYEYEVAGEGDYLGARDAEGDHQEARNAEVNNCQGDMTEDGNNNLIYLQPLLSREESEPN